MSKNICETTRGLLKKDSRPLLFIAEQAGVKYSWLQKFKGGRFKNPGVNTIEKLHEFLTAAPSEET